LPDTGGTRVERRLRVQCEPLAKRERLILQPSSASLKFRNTSDSRLPTAFGVTDCALAIRIVSRQLLRVGQRCRGVVDLALRGRQSLRGSGQPLVEQDSVRQSLPDGFSHIVLSLTNPERRCTQGDDDVDGFLADSCYVVSLDSRKKRCDLLQLTINKYLLGTTRSSPSGA
jgi:hypothetical protein